MKNKIQMCAHTHTNAHAYNVYTHTHTHIYNMTYLDKNKYDLYMI